MLASLVEVDNAHPLCDTPGYPHHGQRGWPAEWEAARAVSDGDVGVGVSRLYRGALPPGAGVEVVAGAKEAGEVLLENTVKAFCSMLETGDGGGGGSVPTQVSWTWRMC